MARVKKSVVKLSGKVGPVVYRDFGNNDDFVSARCNKYKVNKKLTEVQSKLQFYHAANLARTVVKFPEMKEVWKQSKMPGKRGYNRIITANIKLLKESNPSMENIITPKGRALHFEILKLNKENLKCSFGMYGLIKPPFKIILIIMFYKPIKLNREPSYSISYFSTVTPESAGKLKSRGEPGKYNIDVLIGGDLDFNRTRFQNVILYAAVVGTPTIKGKSWWTSTAAVDITDLKTIEVEEV